MLRVPTRFVGGQRPGSADLVAIGGCLDADIEELNGGGDVLEGVSCNLTEAISVSCLARAIPSDWVSMT